jgi:hypothetical protein
MASATRHDAPEAISVRDTMANQVWSCRTEDEVDTALETMRTNQVHRLPVVDGNDRLAGVISFSDIVRHATLDGKIRSIGDHDLITAYRTIKAPAHRQGFRRRFRSWRDPRGVKQGAGGALPPATAVSAAARSALQADADARPPAFQAPSLVFRLFAWSRCAEIVGRACSSMDLSSAFCAEGMSVLSSWSSTAWCRSTSALT